MTNLSALKTECEKSILAANDLAALDAIRVEALGKKGRVTELLKTLGTLPETDRKEFGASVNQVKSELETLIEVRKTALSRAALDARLSSEKADITLSPRPESHGALHPVSKTIAEITEIFARMGFAVAEGPDIESDEYNFTLLNIPPDHPARQMQDSFYLQTGAEDQSARAVVPDAAAAGTERMAQNQPKVLRTQTSPVQVRTMLSQKPPIRIIAPGRTFRHDSDQTHSPMFHQVEGLVIDEATHMGHLKGTLMDFLRAYFDVPDLKVRFRPSYFPFTEPSAEVDIGCSRAGGKIKVGAGEDWLEILGCGMVHEKVLTNCNIDASKYQGFAFGMGVERLAMLKYGIPDLRTFYEGDLRWLKHYGFNPLEA